MDYCISAVILFSITGNIIAYLLIQQQRKQMDDMEDTINGLWYFGSPIGDDDEE